MYDPTLNLRGKQFSCYCLQAFSTKEILKDHIKDCFEINGKKKFIIPKETNMLNSKITKEK